ncbi:MAG: lysine 2,3-aminomutase, partial [Nocardioidaceae bacterium]|nr:lysine 2,3-aminomutase [Nocardioidaceae bacterium]
MTVTSTSASGAMQPYAYQRVELVEPDWTRFPGWRDVTADEWASVQWQRAHCVKNVKQLRELMGDLVDERFYADLERDQAERATMSMLVPPQMMNTMAPRVDPTGPGSLTEAFYADPVRRYMIPVFSDRRTDWASHPQATRDSLHEHDMWVAEGLTHRYPTKVLAELLPTCPQYCGHCTRMDLVGNSTPVIDKLKFVGKPADRLGDMLDYLRRTPQVRDVVVSGGDVANMPWPRLEAFLDQLLEIDNIRDIRLATKALMALPQHWLQPEVVDGMGRVAGKARTRGVSIAIHTHVNHANSVTPLVADATRAMFDAGVRDVRNQGVLLNGVNADPHVLLDLAFSLLDGAGIMPYYFYM